MYFLILIYFLFSPFLKQWLQSEAKVLFIQAQRSTNTKLYVFKCEISARNKTDTWKHSIKVVSAKYFFWCQAI